MDRVVDAAESAVDSVPSVGGEAVSGPVSSGRSDEAPAPVFQKGSKGSSGADAGAGDASARGRGKAFGPPVSVRAAEVAALQRWLARVWPAVALGGNGGGGFAAAEVIAGELLRPALAAVTGLLLASAPTLPASADPPPAGRQGVAGASKSSPTLVPVAGDGGGVVYLIGIAGLLALLAFTVWREFDVALRPWQHRH